MRAFDQLSRSLPERRFWEILAVLLLLFVLGSFLWYQNDPSETYFRRYEMSTVPVQLPWWQVRALPSAGSTER